MLGRFWEVRMTDFIHGSLGFCSVRHFRGFFSGGLGKVVLWARPRLALSILAVGFAEEDCFHETNGSSEFRQGTW